MVHCCNEGKSSPVQTPCEIRQNHIAGHLADDLAPGTINSIFKQAQLKD